METSRSVAGSRVTSRPPIRMRPRFTISRPAIMRSVVVLPQPLGPNRVTRLPASISKEMPSTATTSPNALVTFSKRTDAAWPPRSLLIAVPSSPFF